MKPSLIVEFSSNMNYGQDTTKFRLGNQAVSVSKDKNANLKITYSKKQFLYSPADFLLTLLKSKNSFTKGKNGWFQVSQSQMEDVINLNGKRVVVRFDQLQGNYADETEAKADVSYFSGYLIIPQ